MPLNRQERLNQYESAKAALNKIIRSDDSSDTQKDQARRAREQLAFALAKCVDDQMRIAGVELERLMRCLAEVAQAADGSPLRNAAGVLRGVVTALKGDA